MRVRLVGWRVQPIVMVDDGDNLTPITVKPVELPAAEWAAFKNGGDDQAIAEIEAQIAEQADELTPDRAARRVNGKAKAV